MTTRLPRFAVMRATALSALGFAALVAACDARMPTAPEIEAMDVAAAELQVRRLQLVAAKAAQEFEDGKVTYLVDGKPVSAEEARALGPDKITRMAMLRRPTGEGIQMTIRTDTVRIGTLPRSSMAEGIQEAYIAGYEAGQEAHMRAVREMEAVGVEGKRTRIAIRGVEKGERSGSFVRAGDFEGLMFIDGVLAQPSQFRSINPDQIESIEIIKGPAATKLHSDPKAVNGVIRIITKAGATQR